MPVQARTPVVRLAIAVLAFGGALASTVLAGPDIDEATSSRPDAGATPASARQVRGLNAVGGTTLARMSGTVSAAPAGFQAAPTDMVDMFMFQVTTPSAFTATVDSTTPFETSLWLFWLKPVSGGGFEARPVAGNNAKFVGATYSSVSFPPGSTAYQDGVYAIAITQRGVRPFGYDGTGSPVELFAAPAIDDTGLMLPISTEAVLRIWGGEPTTGGAYAVEAEGATFIPPTTGTGQCGSQFAGSCFEQHSTKGCDDVACCTTVCQIDAFCCGASWDALCAQLAFQNCVIFDCPDPVCPADLNDDGQVDGSDLGIMLSAWGPCS